MTILIYDVGHGGQSCYMAYGGRGGPVLPLYECGLPVGGHSEHITGPFQYCAVGDMLIDIHHTDRLF